MRVSNLSNHFVLVGPPWVVCNSKSSDTATAYFKVWDSQRGTRAANLIGHSLQFGHWTSRVMEASANPRASLCQRCWRWGHSSQTCHQKMPWGPTRSAGGVIGDVCIFLQNVNKNYAHVDYVLEALKDSFDILFFQEPPWRTIRQMVSTTSEGGNDVMGAPKHPDWLYMVRPPTNGQNPRVMAYVHRRLAVLHPSMWRDIIDHRDLLILSLFTPRGTVNLLNVYSDDAHTVINLLLRDVDQLPAFIYMGSDFNCHLEVWDSSCTLHPLVAQHFLELASDIGLEWAWPSNSGLTHIPHNPDLAGSVIDLVFTVPSVSVSDLPQLDLDRHGPSDHVPISTLVPLSEIDIRITRMVIPRESPEESRFLIDLATGLRSLDVGDLLSSDRIEAAALAVAEVFSSAWNTHVKEITVTGRSWSWWTDECSAAIAKYWESHTPGDWKAFHKTSHLAKRHFFDNHIKEIAVENQRPWDLMAWVKPQQLPPCEAISHQGESCHDIDDLWRVLDQMYNAASGQPCDVMVLEELSLLAERDWFPFSVLEVREALSACSSHFLPSPDHVTWVHLKELLSDDVIIGKVLALADACLMVRYWPSYFKESVSVIIPKPGKPSYSMPKSFRPIVLLNTLGKLIEKMLSRCLQFDGVKYSIFHSNQLSGI
ncbi:hypothetical protein AN958_07852 [Leucoagaricus sp. SymC.cos]|nr:hypothetical protein AN958_07852 [Leucoagaricus sp. SymC.cos]